MSIDVINHKMKPLLSICVFVTALLLGVAAAIPKNYQSTKDAFINGIVDTYLKLPMPKGRESAYRGELADKLFNALTNEYPERLFLVDVYAPIMGWENHATETFDLYDRLHKANDMRFNVKVTSIEKGSYPHANAH